MKKTTWQIEAAKLENKTLGRVGIILLKALKRYPKLYAERKAHGDLHEYLLVQEAEVAKQAKMLVDDGAEPWQAESDALREAIENMIPPEPEDDDDEEAEDILMEACGAWLESMDDGGADRGRCPAVDSASYKLGPLTPQEIESLRQDKRDSLKRLGEIFQRSASQPAPK